VQAANAQPITTATVISAAFLVSNRAKIGKALTAARAAPTAKTGRRPIRS